MTHEITPAMTLECKHCGERPPENSPLEAMHLHMQVDHDTDKIELVLVAVCTCGAAMDFQRTLKGDRRQLIDRFICGACGNTGGVKRQP